MPRKRSEKAPKLLDIEKNLTPARREIFLRLSQKKWFKNSDNIIKAELLSLPEDFNGFLVDLANRPESIGYVEVAKLIKLARGNWQIIPIFEVRSNLTNEKFTYEFSSWKHGRNPGSRGIILVEVDDEIKYFLIRKGEKFPIGGFIYDAIGTFSLEIASNKLINLPKSIDGSFLRTWVSKPLA